MGLFSKKRPKKEDSIIQEIEHEMSFLIDSCNFDIIEKSIFQRRIVIYRNNFVQIEFAAEQSYFHCELRRLINDIPSKYSDKNNSIGFEDIAIIESNHSYNHLDYFAGGSNMTKVLKNTRDLLARNHEIISTNKWIDTNLLHKLKDDHYLKTFGIKRTQKTPFIELVNEIMDKHLVPLGFKKVFDSRNIAPYDPRAMVKQIEYQKGKKKLNISQVDWRVYYYIWELKYNNKSVLQIDFKKIKIQREALILLENKIEEIKATANIT